MWNYKKNKSKVLLFIENSINIYVVISDFDFKKHTWNNGIYCSNIDIARKIYERGKKLFWRNINMLI